VGGLVDDHLQRRPPAAALDQAVRLNLNAFFIISIFVNIGMWYERFVIIVPSLAHSYEPWKFLNYHMSWVEASILLGSFGWFFMWFLLFLRFLPASRSRRSRRSCRRR
jgi:hypothetical protein